LASLQLPPPLDPEGASDASERATTRGRHIYFGRGVFEPESRARLVAALPVFLRTPVALDGGSGADVGEAAADRFADATVGPGEHSPPALAPPADDTIGVTERAVAGAGAPLTEDVRRDLERESGADLAHVRVHTGAPAARAARYLGARAFRFGDDIGFADGQYRPGTYEGRRLIAHEVAHVLHHAPGIQLFRWPWETPPTGAQLVADAVGGDLDAIRELRDFSSTSEAQRLAMIDRLTGQFHVGGSDEAALARVWSSFGPAFARVAGENPRHWRNSVARYSGIYDAIPEAQRIRQAFVSDVRAAAFGNLRINREFARQEMQRFGLPERANAAAAPLTAEQSGEVARLQVAAEGLAKLQRAQELARSAYVGFQQELRSSESDRPIYSRVHFDPDAPPPLTALPGGSLEVYDDRSERYVSFNSYGLPAPPGTPMGEAEEFVASINERQRLTTITPYAPLKAAYDQVQAAIAAHLAAFPQLYALSVQGDSAAIARLANAGSPEEARGVLANAFRTLLGNIARTEQHLTGGSLDPLDLTPLHERLFTSAARGASGVVWSQPFPRAVGELLARDRHVEVALRRLLLQTVAELAFLFAPIAGPAAVPLLLVGATATGANLALDASRYQALAAAAGAGARPGTELVTRAAVDEARIAMESEALAFALAVLAVGTVAAQAALRGIRAIPQARLTAQRARILQRIGPASGVRTMRPSEIPYGIPESEMQVVRPGSPLRFDQLQPNRRYLWVLDEKGNFRVADEGQGARFPRRYPLENPHPSAGETPPEAR
jgi:hypothetical protein